jgi:hypothetical protein
LLPSDSPAITAKTARNQQMMCKFIRLLTAHGSRCWSY